MSLDLQRNRGGIAGDRIVAISFKVARIKFGERSHAPICALVCIALRTFIYATARANSSIDWLKFVEASAVDGKSDSAPRRARRV